jgi:hypothetical protein
MVFSSLNEWQTNNIQTSNIVKHRIFTQENIITLEAEHFCEHYNQETNQWKTVGT